MSDLRQVLSQGRKRIGLLVGAGAPMSIPRLVDPDQPLKAEPLIPGANALTGLVIAAIEENDLRKAANAVRAELGPTANIETILSRVRLLQQVLGAVKVHDLDGPAFAKLGSRICEQIGKIVDARLPTFPNGYHDLIAWVGGTTRSHPIEIFTTNYDLLFEEAFERVRMPYFDGFSGGASPFFDSVSVNGDDLPPRWSRLWKLHGSLGWRLEDDAVVRTGGRGEAQLIYPDHLKYDLTKKQPYTSLFERLRTFLLKPDTLLLATGFSFRDAHICAVLDESLAINANAAVIAFQFGGLVEETAVCKLASDRRNVSVYCWDGAVVNGVSGKWRLGELPKGWGEIRATFWGDVASAKSKGLLLGNFQNFASFCALTKATELAIASTQTTSTSVEEAAHSDKQS